MKHTRLAVTAVAAYLLISPFKAATVPQERVITDQDVKNLTFEDLKYPLAARLSHVQGVVVIRASLDEAGRIIDVVAISGADQLIADCLANARKWRFRPNPQKTAVIVYDFRIDPGFCHGVTPSQSVFRPPNFLSIVGCEVAPEY